MRWNAFPQPQFLAKHPRGAQSWHARANLSDLVKETRLQLTVREWRDV
jgi:hypothetical protein